MNSLAHLLLFTLEAVQLLFTVRSSHSFDWLLLKWTTSLIRQNTEVKLRLKKVKPIHQSPAVESLGTLLGSVPEVSAPHSKSH